ncbi:hypothetical protein [Nocardia otitidiscaviarum]|uniref:hypothetical protein n=1 Tax=Nocardia otitidiscaviarum TaxID=1823 RepID=UPI0004A6AF2A|nr:hypothetical protein [Nocardia otitidiscaviarum]
MTIGHAYRTGLRPTWDGWPFVDSRAVVYAVEPPVIWTDGVTTHVIVAHCKQTGAVEVYPAQDTGALVDWAFLVKGGSPNHMSALSALGYEVVTVDGRA